MTRSTIFNKLTKFILTLSVFLVFFITQLVSAKDSIKQLFIDNDLAFFYKILLSQDFTISPSAVDYLQKQISIESVTDTVTGTTGNYLFSLDFDTSQITNLSRYVQTICREDMNARTNQSGTRVRYYCDLDALEYKKMLQEVINSTNANGRLIQQDSMKLYINHKNRNGVEIEQYKYNFNFYSLTRSINHSTIDKTKPINIAPYQSSVFVFSVNEDINYNNYFNNLKFYDFRNTELKWKKLSSLPSTFKGIERWSVYNSNNTKNNIYTDKVTIGIKKLSSYDNKNLYMLILANDTVADQNFLIDFNYLLKDSYVSELIPIYYNSSIPTKDGFIDNDRVPESLKPYYNLYVDHLKRIADAMTETNSTQDFNAYQTESTLNQNKYVLEDTTRQLEQDENYNNAKNEIRNFNVDNMLNNGGAGNEMYYVSAASGNLIHIVDSFISYPPIKIIITASLFIAVGMFFLGRK